MSWASIIHQYTILTIWHCTYLHMYQDKMSHVITKCASWHLLPAKSRTNLGNHASLRRIRLSMNPGLCRRRKTGLNQTARIRWLIRITFWRTSPDSCVRRKQELIWLFCGDHNRVIIDLLIMDRSLSVACVNQLIDSRFRRYLDAMEVSMFVTRIGVASRQKFAFGQTFWLARSSDVHQMLFR